MTVQEHSIKVGNLDWFYREATPNQPTDQPPVLLLHGLPSLSYGWRDVLPALADQGFRAIAPDWIGFGQSSKPDLLDFRYSPAAFREALAALIEALALDKFSLVIQGFLGTVGLQYALMNRDRIERLVILNAPITSEAQVPWKIKQLGLPLIGDMITQDPLTVDRTLETGGQYQVAEADLSVYRAPFLKSSAAGRSLLATVRNLQLKAVTTEISQGFSDWTKPTLLIWGINDPWLPVSQAESFTKTVKSAELAQLAEVGHYPQEDWHEKVNEALIPFLRKMNLE